MYEQDLDDDDDDGGAIASWWARAVGQIYRQSHSNLLRILRHAFMREKRYRHLK